MNLNYVLFQGDNLERFEQILDNTVDSIVCDPPYGLKFMAKGWDSIGEGADQREWHRAWLKEAYRVLKPNGVIKAFSGTRTFHHLAYMIEETGFKNVKIEAWTYGSGFPKSLNIGKAIDKKLGNKREIVGCKVRGSVQDAIKKGVGYSADPANQNNTKLFGYGTEIITKGTSKWEGYGTALKPAWEPIVTAIKL
jgi:site-specific DNA-methyltransferase (adenine-specific)